MCECSRGWETLARSVSVDGMRVPSLVSGLDVSCQFCLKGGGVLPAVSRGVLALHHSLIFYFIVCACVCDHVCVHTSVNIRYHPQFLLLISLGHVLSLNLVPTGLDWLTSKGSFCLYLPYDEITGTPCPAITNVNQTQVLLFRWQAFYPLSHFPSWPLSSLALLFPRRLTDLSEL